MLFVTVSNQDSIWLVVDIHNTEKVMGELFATFSIRQWCETVNPKTKIDTKSDQYH
jgi:hypothetical protein